MAKRLWWPTTTAAPIRPLSVAGPVGGRPAAGGVAVLAVPMNTAVLTNVFPGLEAMACAKLAPPGLPRWRLRRVQAVRSGTATPSIGPRIRASCCCARRRRADLEGNGPCGGLVVGGFELVEHGRFEVAQFLLVVVAHRSAA